MFADVLRELGTHQLRTSNIAVIPINTNNKSFHVGCRELRPTDHPDQCLQSEATAGELGDQVESKFADESVASGNAPETILRMVVYVECEEPIRQPSVLDAVDGVAPAGEFLADRHARGRFAHAGAISALLPAVCAAERRRGVGPHPSAHSRATRGDASARRRAARRRRPAVGA